MLARALGSDRCFVIVSKEQFRPVISGLGPGIAGERKQAIGDQTVASAAPSVGAARTAVAGPPAEVGQFAVLSPSAVLGGDAGSSELGPQAAPAGGQAERQEQVGPVEHEIRDGDVGCICKVLTAHSTPDGRSAIEIICQTRVRLSRVS